MSASIKATTTEHNEKGKMVWESSWEPIDPTGDCVRTSLRGEFPYEEFSCLYPTIGKTYFGWEYFLRASLQEQVNFHSRKVGCGKCLVLVSIYLNVATRWDCNRRSCSLESSIYEQKLSYGIILYSIDQEYFARHKRRTLSAYKEVSTGYSFSFTTMICVAMPTHERF